ncbi:complex I subunit 5 family protein [Nitrolancea hollandica]|uniref:Putative Na+/H+ antiporter subunit D n=1 Tax=Nitrolancea hollandica Lb TaxID=1129897 RepID=I4EJ79_9BACT|nr:proton-conducting transporter membrane subunit [Nitrolancea hollandica]CCF84741.1 putative Na+/H+ antiporter subunit D [Nitrolancea hollandica Lb]
MLLLPLAITWFGALALTPFNGRRRAVGLAAIAILAAAYLALGWLAFLVLAGGPIEMIAGNWGPGIGIRIRADALGIAFALISIGVLLAALAYEVLGGVHERTLPESLLFMATGLLGVFLTADIFNFYVFFEIAMISSFALASYGKETRHLRAALTFTVVNLLGSAVFLAGIVALYHVTGTLDMDGVAQRVSSVPAGSVLLIAVLIFVAFGLKLGIFPFHGWVPVVYRDTWPAIAAVLSAALANIGSYGLLRFGAGLMPRELTLTAEGLILIGSMSILYGAFQAVGARTASEVIAWSAIGQVGYILVALGVGGPVGLGAAILYTIVNALNKLVLFLAVGLRGWLVGAAFALAAFSVAGVPPSAGFFGKVALFRAGVTAGNTALLVLIFLGGALSLLYLFQLYQRDYWARPAEFPPSPLPARILVLALAAGVVLLGLWPEPLLALSAMAAAVLPGGG